MLAQSMCGLGPQGFPTLSPFAPQFPARGLRSGSAGARSPWWSPGKSPVMFLKVSLWHPQGPPLPPRVPPALNEAECGGEEGMGENQEGMKGTFTLPLSAASCPASGFPACPGTPWRGLWVRVRDRAGVGNGTGCEEFPFLGGCPVAGTSRGQTPPGTRRHCVPAGAGRPGTICFSPTSVHAPPPPPRTTSCPGPEGICSQTQGQELPSRLGVETG